MEATARKLNNYSRLPYCLLKSFSHTQAFVMSDVYSFTGANMTCHRTYKTFGSRAGCSRATVGRALRNGKAQKLISIDKDKGYVFNLDKLEDESFMRIPDFVKVKEFEVRKNKFRRLLATEQAIFGYIFTHCDNQKRSNKSCEVSISELAKALGLSERTIQRNRWALIRCGLIYCPRGDKGVNAYKKSRYTVNYNLIREEEKKAKAASKAAMKEQEPQALPKTRAEIEGMYCEKQHRAQEVAERNLQKAREYERFKLADDTVKYMGISAAFAECGMFNRQREQAAEFEQRLLRAQAERLIALREIGLTEQDLDPQYECKQCNDTGYLPNGRRCSCYPSGVSPGGDGDKNVGAGEQNK